jgi:hypothetical protein
VPTIDPNPNEHDRPLWEASNNKTHRGFDPAWYSPPVGGICECASPHTAEGLVPLMCFWNCAVYVVRGVELGGCCSKMSFGDATSSRLVAYAIMSAVGYPTHVRHWCLDVGDVILLMTHVFLYTVPPTLTYTILM